MTRRPGRIKEIVDAGSVRRAEKWGTYERIEDVMDLESFVHLRIILALAPGGEERQWAMIVNRA